LPLQLPFVVSAGSELPAGQRLLICISGNNYSSEQDLQRGITGRQQQPV